MTNINNEENYILTKLNEIKRTGHNQHDPFCFDFDTHNFLKFEYLETLISLSHIFDKQSALDNRNNQEQQGQTRAIFEQIKSALSKSRYIFSHIDIMPKENFPDSVNTIDTTFDNAEKNNNIAQLNPKHDAKKIIANADFEKIEALELIFKALNKLETLINENKLDIETFIWLEHHIQRLKILFIATRQFTEIYLIYRFAKQERLNYSKSTFRAKCNDLRTTIRNNRIVLDEFNALKLTQIIDNLQTLICKE